MAASRYNRKHTKAVAATALPRKNRIIRIFLNGLFFVGIVLFFLEITIYRRTLIPIYIPVNIFLITGFTATFLLKRVLMIYAKMPSFLVRSIYGLVAFGMLATFLFMWTNELFAGKSTRVTQNAIVSSGYMTQRKSKCKRPYVVVDYEGLLHKRFILGCGVITEGRENVVLEVAAGKWGFDVVKRVVLR